ncbi:hypothetical protein CASFOL_039602 [Castilleja foliolosa]|uniref:Uncharacterized protein n=1 Tax=Castilleja foliolosa TaxID=1961234 RepID=A0ABD3BFX3_9LAMI
MSSNGHDIQVCVCKSLKQLSNICFTFSLQHPFWSFSVLCLFLLYMVFPLVFWVLVYSVPLIVCTSIILSFPFSTKTHKNVVETNDDENRQTTQASHEPAKGNEGKKPFTRVHSVRRRRAKEFARDVEDNNKTQQCVDDKNEVFNREAVIDKNALVTEENSPKDIREVDIVQDYSIVNSTKSSSCSASQSPKHEYNESEYQSLDDGKENGNNNNNNIINNNKAVVQGNEDEDNQKNKMDYVGISDSERTKRLESLIARRRSRKLLSLEVRRTLMNKGKKRDHGQITSVLVPKINNTPNRLMIPKNASVGSLHSPSPGSAPSVLVPMRNPFDLPYDPQEEKPDLTGDGFAKEFMPPVSNIGRDGMFCRHESFSSGPSFLRPGEYSNRSLKQMSLDSRFRQRASSSFSSSSSSSMVYHQSAGKEFGGEFAPKMEDETKSSISETDNDDHIKEIIQVHENGSEDDGDIDDDGEVQTRASREDASWRSPTSSEEDTAPVFKIDREAILKSLSSMARRNVLPEETEINNTEQNGEHLSGLKDRFYYSDRPMTRRGPASHSIASDLQVEVSEISSPPLTIDENMSYPDYDDEDNRSNADSWGHFDLSQVDEYESSFLVQVPEDTPLPNEPHCAHPWCSIAEFPDSCHTKRATNLDEKIDKTLQRSASLLAQTPKRNDSMKRAEDSNTFDVVHENNTNEIEESSTMSSDEKLEPEHREVIIEPAIVEERIDLGSTQHSEGEQSSSEAIVSFTHGAPRSNNNNNILMPNAFDLAQSSPSPKSVLHPTCSVASFDHYMDDEAQQFNARVILLSPGPFAVSASGEGVGGLEQEPSEPSNTSTTEAEVQNEILENVIKPEEVASVSPQVDAEPTEEANINNDQSTDHSKNSNSPILTKEELSKRHEIAVGKTKQDDSNNSNSSSLHEDKGHEYDEKNLNKPKDQESSTSYGFDTTTNDEVMNNSGAKTHTFELSGESLEDNVNSDRSYNKNEDDTKNEQHQTSHESMQLPEDRKEIEQQNYAH